MQWIRVAVLTACVACVPPSVLGPQVGRDLGEPCNQLAVGGFGRTEAQGGGGGAELTAGVPLDDSGLVRAAAVLGMGFRAYEGRELAPGGLVAGGGFTLYPLAGDAGDLGMGLRLGVLWAEVDAIGRLALGHRVHAIGSFRTGGSSTYALNIDPYGGGSGGSFEPASAWVLGEGGLQLGLEEVGLLATMGGGVMDGEPVLAGTVGLTFLR